MDKWVDRVALRMNTVCVCVCVCQHGMINNMACQSTLQIYYLNITHTDNTNSFIICFQLNNKYTQGEA